MNGSRTILISSISSNPTSAPLLLYTPSLSLSLLFDDCPDLSLLYCKKIYIYDLSFPCFVVNEGLGTGMWELSVV